MELLEGLKTRRTIYKFQTKPIEKEIIEQILSCAVLAPNHKLTEPWHFYVLTGDIKNKLAEKRREIKLSTFEDPESEKAKMAGEQAYRFLADVPVMIAVTTKKSDDKIREKEDYAAVSCAVQNMMLAAWNFGIGSYWGTGPLTRKEIAYQIIGADMDQEEIVGFIFFGYPVEVPKDKERKFEHKTTWYWEE